MSKNEPTLIEIKKTPTHGAITHIVDEYQTPRYRRHK